MKNIDVEKLKIRTNANKLIYIAGILENYGLSKIEELNGKRCNKKYEEEILDYFKTVCGNDEHIKFYFKDHSLVISWNMPRYLFNYKDRIINHCSYIKTRLLGDKCADLDYFLDDTTNWNTRYICVYEVDNNSNGAIICKYNVEMLKEEIKSLKDTIQKDLAKIDVFEEEAVKLQNATAVLIEAYKKWDKCARTETGTILYRNNIPYLGSVGYNCLTPEIRDVFMESDYTTKRISLNDFIDSLAGKIDKSEFEWDKIKSVRVDEERCKLIVGTNKHRIVYDFVTKVSEVVNK